MIFIEEIGNVLPTLQSGKIVGIASCRDQVIVACEYGLFRLWDDGVQIRATETHEPSSSTGEQ